MTKTCFISETACLCQNSCATRDARQMRVTDKNTPQLPFESRLHIHFSTNNPFSQLRSPDDLDCCFMVFRSWRKPPGPRIMRKLWSKTCERAQNKEKEQAEDRSYSKEIEIMLRETARKSYPDPENIHNPMIAPLDNEIRQSGRVLELQNRDLWTRPTDLSRLFVSCLSKIIVEGQLRSWKPGMKPRSKRLRKMGSSDQTRKNTSWQSHLSWQ